MAAGYSAGVDSTCPAAAAAADSLVVGIPAGQADKSRLAGCGIEAVGIAGSD